MENHPIAECYPKLSQGEFEQLKAHIAANGLQNSIVLYEGKILDGTQRARACQELGIEPAYVTPEIKDPYEYVIGQNERRRQLTAGQRAVVGERMATLKQGSNRYAQKVEVSAETSRKQTVHATLKEVANQIKVGRSSIEKVRYTKEKGIPELVTAIEAGEIAVESARQIAHLPKEQQVAALKGATQNKRKKTSRTNQQTPVPDTDPVSTHRETIETKALERINQPSLYPKDLPLPVVPDFPDKTRHIQEAIIELEPLESQIATMGWRQLYDDVQLCVQRIQTYGSKFTRVGLGDYRIEMPWQKWAEDVGQKVQQRVNVLLANKRSNGNSKAKRRPKPGPEQRLHDYGKKLKRLLGEIDFLNQEAQEVYAETMLVVTTYFEQRVALYGNRGAQHKNGATPIGNTLLSTT